MLSSDIKFLIEQWFHTYWWIAFFILLRKIFRILIHNQFWCFAIKCKNLRLKNPKTFPCKKAAKLSFFLIRTLCWISLFLFPFNTSFLDPITCQNQSCNKWVHCVVPHVSFKRLWLDWWTLNPNILHFKCRIIVV